MYSFQVEVMEFLRSSRVFGRVFPFSKLMLQTKTLLEKLTVAWMFTKSHIFCEIWMSIITMLTKTRYFTTLSWTSWNHSTFSISKCSKSTLILFLELRTTLSSVVVLSGFPIENLQPFFISPMRAICFTKRKLFEVKMWYALMSYRLCPLYLWACFGILALYNVPNYN